MEFFFKEVSEIWSDGSLFGNSTIIAAVRHSHMPSLPQQERCISFALKILLLQLCRKHATHVVTSRFPGAYKKNQVIEERRGISLNQTPSISRNTFTSRTWRGKTITAPSRVKGTMIPVSYLKVCPRTFFLFLFLQLLSLWGTSYYDGTTENKYMSQCRTTVSCGGARSLPVHLAVDKGVLHQTLEPGLCRGP